MLGSIQRSLVTTMRLAGNQLRVQEVAAPGQEANWLLVLASYINQASVFPWFVKDLRACNWRGGGLGVVPPKRGFYSPYPNQALVLVPKPNQPNQQRQRVLAIQRHISADQSVAILEKRKLALPQESYLHFSITNMQFHIILVHFLCHTSVVKHWVS